MRSPSRRCLDCQSGLCCELNVVQSTIQKLHCKTNYCDSSLPPLCLSVISAPVEWEVIRGQRVQRQESIRSHESQHTCEECSLLTFSFFFFFFSCASMLGDGVMLFQFVYRWLLFVFCFQDQFLFRQSRGRRREQRPTACFCSFCPVSSVHLFVPGLLLGII